MKTRRLRPALSTLCLAVLAAAATAANDQPVLSYSVNSVVFGWNLADKRISVDEIATLPGPLAAPGPESDEPQTLIPISKDGQSFFRVNVPQARVRAADVAESVNETLRERFETNALAAGVSLHDVMARAGEGLAGRPGPETSGFRWQYIRRGALVDEGPLWEIKGLAGLFLANEKPDLADLSPLEDLRALPGDSRLWLDLSGNLMHDPRVLAGLTNTWWLYLNGISLSNAAPVARLPQLRTLHLSDNAVRDLRPLAGLSALKRLYLSRNGVADVAPLAALKGLTGLDLSANAVTDVRPLAGLAALEWLHLGGNAVKDLTPLASLTGLQSLNLGANAARDVSPLAGLTNLVMLHLPANGLTQIAPLAGLARLQVLNLAQNEVADLAPLAGLKNLRRLYLFGNPVKDLAPLVKNAESGGLGKGSEVWLVGAPLSEEARTVQIPLLRTKYGVTIHE